MKLNNVNAIAETEVSHNANIKRRRMIEFGEIAGLTNFSQATFPAGEVAPAHSHTDMVEIFFVKQGSGTIIIDGSAYALTEGDCIRVDINESHELQNTTEQPLTVIYFGITVSPQ